MSRGVLCGGSSMWRLNPYFSGRGGITGPNGLAPVDAAARFSADLRGTDDRVVANVTLRL